MKTGYPTWVMAERIIRERERGKKEWVKLRGREVQSSACVRARTSIPLTFTPYPPNASNAQIKILHRVKNWLHAGVNTGASYRSQPSRVWSMHQLNLPLRLCKYRKVYSADASSQTTLDLASLHQRFYLILRRNPMYCLLSGPARLYN